MYCVYLLQGQNSKIYIGYSSNLKRRIDEHRRGRVYYTRRLKDFSVLYYEVYANIEAAKDRERKLKQYGSAYHGLLKRLRIKK